MDGEKRIIFFQKVCKREKIIYELRMEDAIAIKHHYIPDAVSMIEKLAAQKIHNFKEEIHSQW